MTGISADRRKRLADARNFIVYYGHDGSDILSKYDLAIVEPAGHDENSLEMMRASGTLIIAYVSITEVPDYDTFKPLLRSSDFLTLNGSIIQNTDYHTSLADMRSHNWINLLMHRIGGLLRISRYDGIFMDTISNVEWPFLPAGIRAEQQDAAVELVRRLRKLYPDHLLLQNNGLDSLCEQTGPFIDGLCWENPDFVRPETYKWHEDARLRVKRLISEHGFRVMMLLEEGSISEAGIESVKYLVKRENYLMYISSDRYLEVRSLEH